MTIEVKVPAVGESVQEAMIQSWKKNSGTWINRDEVLCELETDKATVEVVAESSGQLDIVVAAGKVVKVGTVIAKLDDKAEKKPTESIGAPKLQVQATPPVIAVSHPDKHNDAANHVDPGPAVRRMKEELQLNLTQVDGTGRGGRVTKEDLLNAMSSPEKISKVPESKPFEQKSEIQITKQTPSIPTSGVALSSERQAIRKPMSMLRRRIAERLLHAQQTAAILTTFNEIDMSAVTDLRKKYKEHFEKKHAIKLGFMGFFLKASVQALQEFPDVNAFIEGSDVVHHNYCDIGVAVSTDRGLIVPVIRDVQDLSIVGVEKQIAVYAEKARTNKISIEDLNGGTFTVSNGGVFGSLMSTPILNPPQSAILGMHKTQLRPMVLSDGRIEARPMMYIALSYDHRIIDGKEAVGFLVRIKEIIEDPSRLLLGV